MENSRLTGSYQPITKDLANRVKSIIATYLDLPEELLVEDASLSQDLGADSLEITEMVMAFEEEFGFTINDDMADRFLTVGDIIRHLQASENARADRL
jgi:acyl carrier protein